MSKVTISLEMERSLLDEHVDVLREKTIEAESNGLDDTDAATLLAGLYRAFRAAQVADDARVEAEGKLQKCPSCGSAKPNRVAWTREGAPEGYTIFCANQFHQQEPRP